MAGIRLIVTSRPEGVQITKYKRHFAIVDLKPLSAQQQQQAVEQQLKEFPEGREFANHLLEFSARSGRTSTASTTTTATSTTRWRPPSHYPLLPATDPVTDRY